MPYIKKQRRDDFSDVLIRLMNRLHEIERSEESEKLSAGDINYITSRIAHTYLELKGLRYEHINAVIGALECVKQELYRTIAADYENQKAVENGSVSELDGPFFKKDKNNV